MFSLHSFIKTPNDTQISLEINFTLIITLFKSQKISAKLQKEVWKTATLVENVTRLSKTVQKGKKRGRKRALKYVSHTANRIKVHSICPSGRLTEIYS